MLGAPALAQSCAGAGQTAWPLDATLKVTDETGARLRSEAVAFGTPLPVIRLEGNQALICLPKGAGWIDLSEVALAKTATAATLAPDIYETTRSTLMFWRRLESLERFLGGDVGVGGAQDFTEVIVAPSPSAFVLPVLQTRTVVRSGRSIELIRVHLPLSAEATKVWQQMQAGRADRARPLVILDHSGSSGRFGHESPLDLVRHLDDDPFVRAEIEAVHLTDDGAVYTGVTTLQLAVSDLPSGAGAQPLADLLGRFEPVPGRGVLVLAGGDVDLPDVPVLEAADLIVAQVTPELNPDLQAAATRAEAVVFIGFATDSTELIADALASREGFRTVSGNRAVDYADLFAAQLSNGFLPFLPTDLDDAGALPSPTDGSGGWTALPVWTVRNELILEVGPIR